METDLVTQRSLVISPRAIFVILEVEFSLIGLSLRENGRSVNIGKFFVFVCLFEKTFCKWEKKRWRQLKGNVKKNIWYFLIEEFINVC